MDIEKLIEKANHLGMELKRDGGEFEYSIGKKFLEYATALSTLQAENEKLRAELERMKGIMRYKDYGHPIKISGWSVRLEYSEATRPEGGLTWNG